MKSLVFFLKDFSKLDVALKKLLKGFYQPGSKVLIKIHFGEPGNPRALVPQDVKPIIDVLQKFRLKPVFIDTPVAYHSPRATVEDYGRVVKTRGYHKLADFIISDRSKKVKTKDFTALVCKELVEADNILVISHVKGHSCAGFGGAIKNLGMGGVMPESKRAIHNLCKPKFIKECQGCGTCVRLCPNKAISLVAGKAKIDFNRCLGCSICQLSCPYQVLVPKKAFFDDLLAQGAAAVINHLPKKTYYVNLIKNVSRLCDCERYPGEIISPDLGVLFSDNPVAIDQASVDWVKKINGRDVFEEVNHKDPSLQIQYVAKYTSKSTEYKLIKIA